LKAAALAFPFEDGWPPFDFQSDEPVCQHLHAPELPLGGTRATSSDEGRPDATRTTGAAPAVWGFPGA